MKKIALLKKSLKILATFIVLTSNINIVAKKKVTAQTPPAEPQSYACGAVYPSNVYCPAGQTCVIPAPTCIMNIVIGGSSATETLYNLTVPANEFKTLALKETGNTQLPITSFPALGKRVAYQLTPKIGIFAGVPFNIVIQTELPTDAFINMLAQGSGKLTDQTKKDAANKLLTTLQDFKATDQGVNVLYRSVPALGETQYKLYHVRVPGANNAEALIMATPSGNIQFYENSDKAGVTNVTEIDTGTLSK